MEDRYIKRERGRKEGGRDRYIKRERERKRDGGREVGGGE